MSMSMSMSSLFVLLLSVPGCVLLISEDTGVRGRRVSVVAKWPVWNLLRFRRRSPLEDLGSVGFSFFLV